MIDFIAGCAMGVFITWAVRRVVTAVRKRAFYKAMRTTAVVPAGVFPVAGRSPPRGNFSGPPPPKK